jgi:hypothetical protein
MNAVTFDTNNDDITVPTTNVSATSSKSYKVHALDHILQKSAFAGATFHLKADDAIADSGAMQIFVIKGTLVVSKRPTTRPLKVALADGLQVMSTTCATSPLRASRQSSLAISFLISQLLPCLVFKFCPRQDAR